MILRLVRLRDYTLAIVRIHSKHAMGHPFDTGSKITCPVLRVSQARTNKNTDRTCESGSVFGRAGPFCFLIFVHRELRRAYPIPYVRGVRVQGGGGVRKFCFARRRFTGRECGVYGARIPPNWVG